MLLKKRQPTQLSSTYVLTVRGMSELITVWTPGISSPRAATSVQTITSTSPSRKRWRARYLSAWDKLFESVSSLHMTYQSFDWKASILLCDFLLPEMIPWKLSKLSGESRLTQPTIRSTCYFLQYTQSQVVLPGSLLVLHFPFDSNWILLLSSTPCNRSMIKCIRTINIKYREIHHKQIKLLITRSPPPPSPPLLPEAVASSKQNITTAAFDTFLFLLFFFGSYSINKT